MCHNYKKKMYEEMRKTVQLFKSPFNRSHTLVIKFKFCPSFVIKFNEFLFLLWHSFEIHGNLFFFDLIFVKY